MSWLSRALGLDKVTNRSPEARAVIDGLTAHIKTAIGDPMKAFGRQTTEAQMEELYRRLRMELARRKVAETTLKGLDDAFHDISEDLLEKWF